MKKIAKILSIVLCLAMVLSFASVAIAAENNTVSVVIADYADANGWTNGTLYATVNLDSVVSVTASGTAVGEYGQNTGKYYENGENWRIYQAEGGNITVSAGEAKIVSVKISYASQNDGVLTFNGAIVESEQVVSVNAPSATFAVANKGEKTNGQARITAIEVVYEGKAGEAPIIPTNINVNDKMDAANWTVNGDAVAFENGAIEFNTGDAGVSGAAMLNEPTQNVNYKFNLAINGLASVSMDDWTWWDSELLIVARSTIADASWCDGQQTGYTLTSWGDMKEVYIGRAGYDDAFGAFEWNINDGESHEIEFSVVNNADNTQVTITLTVDGEKIAEVIDDGSATKGDRPNLYPEAGNLTIRAKYLDITVGVPAPVAVEPLQFVAAPVDGTAYKFGMTQATTNQNLYLTGAMKGYYFETTEDIEQAADVYVENVEGGFKLYLMIDGAKTYIDIVPSGKYNNVVFSTEGAKVFAYNAELNALITNVAGTDLYLGTYDKNVTIGASNIKYITAENTGISQFPAGLVEIAVDEPIDPPTEPTEPETQPTEPETQPTEPETQPTEPETQPTEPPVVEHENITITIGDKSFTTVDGKHLYNQDVTAATSTQYNMILIDKNFNGSFATNGWGVAIVLAKDGTLLRVYDGANVGFWTAEGKAAAAHFGANDYATVAFNELQENELLIVFTHTGSEGNAARQFGLNVRSLCGQKATLTGFVWIEDEIVEPTEPETEATTTPAATETIKPTTPGNPGTGDNSPVMLAVGMMMAAACLIVLVQKKRAV